MAQKTLTPAQQTVIHNIARLLEDERTARRMAEVEARALIESRTEEARAKTNAAIFDAYYEQGITKTNITMLALGTTNRQAADARIVEHVDKTGAVVEDKRTVPADATPADLPVLAGIEAKWDGDVLRVTMDQFSHVDVGSGISGEITFSESGEEQHVSEGLRDDPLLPARLWDLDVVQEALSDAH